MKGLLSFFAICAFLILGSLNMASAQIIQQNPKKIDFGIKGSLNFSRLKPRYDKYLGQTKGSLGAFINYHIDRYTAISFEPTYTSCSFKEKQADNRYSFGYLDFNLNTYFNAFRSDDISLYFGLRPALLLSPKSEVLVDGDYIKSDVPGFKSKEGQWDFGINLGMAVRLTKVVTFEAGYCWSATNKTTNDRVQGRPSLVELTLKINAVDLKNVLDNQEIGTKEKIQSYRKGALLVMLPTLTEKELARFASYGDKEFARNEIKIRNLKVIREFRKHYTFTPVYFFMDSDVDKVLANSTTGIFVNDNLENDTSIQLANPSNFFVASFCNDLSSYTQRISYGLFIYDNKMVQLEKPFNVPSQMFGLYTSGDPVNYFKTKRQSYINMPFDRMIKKFSARMTRFAEFE
jgi:hypothetical protein